MILNDGAIWFFWGSPHLSYLRFLTLWSACVVHHDVRLVIRRYPVAPKVDWIEKQDFSSPADGPNWLPAARRLPIVVQDLEDLAPEIAVDEVSDVHTSDLLSFWLLWKYGGTVADMDIVFFRPIPEVVYPYQIVRFTGHPKEGYTPVSFLQGYGNVWEPVYRAARANYRPHLYESCGAPNIPADWHAHQDEKVVFPLAGGALPWSSWHRLFFGDGRVGLSLLDFEGAVGVHWYGSRNQRWNKLVTDAATMPAGLVRDAALIAGKGTLP